MPTNTLQKMQKNRLLVIWCHNLARGGVVSALRHLVLGCKELGVTVEVLRPGAARDEPNYRWVAGAPYRNVTTKTAMALFNAIIHQGGVAIVHKIQLHKTKELPEMAAAKKFIERGCPVFLHSEWEALPWLYEHARNTLVCCNGPVFANWLRNEKGFAKVASLPLPYVPEPIHVGSSPYPVFAMARVHPWKQTQLIVAANDRIFPNDKQIPICGLADDRWYRMRLDKQHPHWRRNYWGPFDGDTAVDIAQNGKFIVDLSHFRNDGGRTQYTFLEIFNARRALVCHTDWFKAEDTTISPHNAFSVTTADDLVRFVHNLPGGKEVEAKIAEGEKTLLQASPEKTLPAMFDALQEHFHG